MSMARVRRGQEINGLFGSWFFIKSFACGVGASHNGAIKHLPESNNIIEMPRLVDLYVCVVNNQIC
jgi:hypothetical protein